MGQATSRPSTETTLEYANDCMKDRQYIAAVTAYKEHLSKVCRGSLAAEPQNISVQILDHIISACKRSFVYGQQADVEELCKLLKNFKTLSFELYNKKDISLEEGIKNKLTELNNLSQNVLELIGIYKKKQAEELFNNINNLVDTVFKKHSVEIRSRIKSFIYAKFIKLAYRNRDFAYCYNLAKVFKNGLLSFSFDESSKESKQIISNACYYAVKSFQKTICVSGRKKLEDWTDEAVGFLNFNTDRKIIKYAQVYHSIDVNYCTEQIRSYFGDLNDMWGKAVFVCTESCKDSLNKTKIIKNLKALKISESLYLIAHMMGNYTLNPLRELIKNSHYELAAQLILSGINLDVQYDGWSYHKDATQEQKVKINNILQLLQYEKLITSNATQKIISVIQPLAPSVSIRPTVGATESKSEDSETASVVSSITTMTSTRINTTLQDFLNRALKGEITKAIKLSPILRIVALASQGIHGITVTGEDRRLLIFVNTMGVVNTTSATDSTPHAQGCYGYMDPRRLCIRIGMTSTFEQSNAFGTLIHEMTHFVCLEIFKNNALPYLDSDITAKELYTSTLSDLEANKSTYPAIFQDIVELYKHDDPDVQKRIRIAEMVVRIPQIFFSGDSEEIQKLKNHDKTKNLLDDFNNRFLPRCKEHYKKVVGEAVNNYGSRLGIGSVSSSFEFSMLEDNDVSPTRGETVTPIRDEGVASAAAPSAVGQIE